MDGLWKVWRESHRKENERERKLEESRGGRFRQKGEYTEKVVSRREAFRREQLGNRSEIYSQNDAALRIERSTLVLSSVVRVVFSVSRSRTWREKLHRLLGVNLQVKLLVPRQTACYGAFRSSAQRVLLISRPPRGYGTAVFPASIQTEIHRNILPSRSTGSVRIVTTAGKCPT